MADKPLHGALCLGLFVALCPSDGTIGLYVEEGEGGYSMVFYRFSPDWLMGEMAGH